MHVEHKHPNPLQAAKQRRCGQVTLPILFREAGQTY